MTYLMLSLHSHADRLHSRLPCAERNSEEQLEPPEQGHQKVKKGESCWQGNRVSYLYFYTGNTAKAYNSREFSHVSCDPKIVVIYDHAYFDARRGTVVSGAVY